MAAAGISQIISISFYSLWQPDAYQYAYATEYHKIL